MVDSEVERIADLMREAHHEVATAWLDTLTDSPPTPSECWAALSRARDDGIEVAARVAGGLLPCQFCTSEDRIAGEPCACDEQRERLAAVIRSLKEDRPR